MPRLTGDIGAFSILAEAAVVGVTVGVLCLAGPGGSLQSPCRLYMLMCRQCKPLPCPGLSPQYCSGFAAWQRAFSSLLAFMPFTRTSGDSSSCCMRLLYDPRTPSRDSQSATQPRGSRTDLPARCRVDRRIWGSKGHGRGFCLDVMLRVSSLLQVDGCVAQFYMSDTSSTSSARSICNIFCYVQLGR
jgi:hypothetical protein